MANFKKEVAALLSRFDAAQEAFTANTTDVKKLRKQHKKDLKKANKQIEALKEEVADLQKQLSAKTSELTLTQAKVMGQESSKSTGAKSKRSPGRPAGKRGPGRPAGKRGPGRPKKTAAAQSTPTTATASVTSAAKTEGATDAPAAPKKRRGRPAGVKNKKTSASGKKTAAAKSATPGVKRRPGRPRTRPVVEASPLTKIAGVGPALAKALEAGGIKTVAQAAKASNSKITEIFNGVGRRYNNPDQAKIQSFRDAAAAAKGA